MKTKTKEVEVDLDAPVWGGEAIGAIINKDKDEVWYGYRRGYYDCTKVGKLLVTTRRRILKSVGVEV